MDKAKDQVEDAAKRAKDAAMKLFGGSKKFQGSGNKLGGGSGSAPVRNASHQGSSCRIVSIPGMVL